MANYSRTRVWSDGDILNASDLNTAFDNEVTNAKPESIDDYSANDNQSNSTADPGTYASPTKPTSLAGELEQLRYVAGRIIGGTNGSHRDVPPASLTSIANSLTTSKAAINFEFEGALGGASSTTDVLAKLINSGGIINPVSRSTADLSTAAFDSTNKKFGAYSLALNGSRCFGVSGKGTNPIRGSASLWFRNLATSDGIICNPLLGISAFLDSSGYVNAKVVEKTAASQTTKNSTSVTGSNNRSGDTTFRHMYMDWRLNAEGGSTTDRLSLKYSNSNEGSQVTGDSITINAGTGGFWFFGAKINEPSWDKFSAMSVLPSSESVSAWSATGTHSASAVSAGVLTIDSTGYGAASSYYERSSNVELSSATFEFKLKIDTISSVDVSNNQSCVFQVRDDTMNRSFALNFDKKYVDVVGGSSFTNAAGTVARIYWDFDNWNVIRVTSSGATNPVITIYINGLQVFSFTNSTADATASDVIRFGDVSASGTENSSSQWEYVKILASSAAAPLTLTTQGNIDSVTITNDILDSTTLTSLQSSKASSVLLPSGRQKPYAPTSIVHNHLAGVAITSTTLNPINTDQDVLYVAGDGVSVFKADAYVTGENGAGNPAQLAIAINDDFAAFATPASTDGVEVARSTSPNLNDPIAMSMARTLVLPVGLNKIQLLGCTNSGTTNYKNSKMFGYFTQIETLAD